MMQKFVLFILCIGCLSAAAAPLPSQQAIYTVTSGNIKVGTIKRTLKTDGQHFSLTIASHASIPLLNLGGTEYSEGRWQHNMPMPSYYRYQYQHKGHIKTKQVNFDYVAKQIHLEPENLILPLQENVQDKISYQLALRQQFTPKQARYVFQVVTGHHIKPYVLTLRGQETITTGLGKQHTWVLQHTSKKRHTVLWLAPKLNNMIVKVHYESTDHVNVTATLHKISYNK